MLSSGERKSPPYFSPNLACSIPMGDKAFRRTQYITTPRFCPPVYADHCHSSTHRSADAISDVVLSAPTAALRSVNKLRFVPLGSN